MPGLATRDFCHNLAAVFTRSRAHVNEVIASMHDGLLVLNDDHRIALVAQLMHDFDKLLDVLLVQAHGRFIEDKKRVGEGGSKARGQVDAFDFPS